MMFGVKMLQNLWYLCWGVLLLFSVTAYKQQSQPNIVFIMVDDMGWNDVSYHGSDQIQTPNIDALAYQGVILQQYYSEAICTPARTALLTGKYPMRLGMHGTPLSNTENRGIPLTERLLPSFLKELGYSTHLVGKWHVGMSMEEYLPESRGYDTHYGMRGGFVDYYTYNLVETLPDGRTMFGLDFFDNGIPQTTEQRYMVDSLTDRAVKIIHRHNSSMPLFLHVAHGAPHSGNTGGALQPPLYGTVKHRHIANSNRRLYAEVVTQVDRSIGRIFSALAENNMLENTIIAFVSDNGSPTVGFTRNWGVNLPFRGKKETPWEGGVRVPAFIWHSDFQPRVWDGMMHITDWLPTLIAAAGGEIRGEIDGVNQWESIKRDGQSNRKEVLLTLEDSDENTYASYRAGDYKIVVGNVTGLDNDFYGTELMANKYSPPEYYETLRSCEIARIFEYIGKPLDYNEVITLRNAAMIRQQDPVRDSTLCLPTPNRGCLFNIRRDPEERHNLWQRANKIATLLTSRLRALWAQQRKRGPVRIDNASDPANFDYVWTPWINESQERKIEQRIPAKLVETAREEELNDLNYTIAGQISCEKDSSYIKNFLCLLRNVF